MINENQTLQMSSCSNSPKIKYILTLSETTNITRVQKFNDVIALISDSNIFLSAIFQCDKAGAGLYHVNYNHTHTVVSLCPVQIDGAYISNQIQKLDFDDGANLMENIWVAADSNDKFLTFSIRHQVFLPLFEFDRIKNIQDTCGLSAEGQFAVSTLYEVFICEIRSSGNSIISSIQTRATRLSSFLDGFLMMVDHKINFYHNSQISTYYDGEVIDDYYVTNEKVAVVQMVEQNVIVHIKNGKTIGILECNGLGVHDVWAVSLCRKKKILVVTNIENRTQNTKLFLPFQAEVINEIRKIVVGYNRRRTALNIILVLLKKIILFKVPFSFICEDDEEEEEDENELENENEFENI